MDKFKFSAIIYAITGTQAIEVRARGGCIYKGGAWQLQTVEADLYNLLKDKDVLLLGAYHDPKARETVITIAVSLED